MIQIWEVVREATVSREAKLHKRLARQKKDDVNEPQNKPHDDGADANVPDESGSGEGAPGGGSPTSDHSGGEYKGEAEGYEDGGEDYGDGSRGYDEEYDEEDGADVDEEGQEGQDNQDEDEDGGVDEDGDEDDGDEDEDGSDRDIRRTTHSPDQLLNNSEGKERTETNEISPQTSLVCGIPREIFGRIVRRAVQVELTSESNIEQHEEDRDAMEASMFYNLGELSRVSKAWRSCITTTPQLWNKIYPSRSIHHIPFWIERAGRHPIRIKINYDNFSADQATRITEESAWVEALAKHSDRWHTIEFKNTPDSVHLIHYWLFVPAPSIRNLIIHDLTSYHQKTQSREGSLLDGLVIKPQRLAIVKITLPLQQLDASRLTYLNLNDTLCPLRDVVNILKTATLLEVLRLAYIPFPPGTPVHPTVQAILDKKKNWTVPKNWQFELSHLRVVELNMLWDQANSILRTVVAPSLQQLKYNSYGLHTKEMFKSIFKTTSPSIAALRDTRSVVTAIFTPESSTVYIEPFIESPPTNHPITLSITITDYSEENDDSLMTQSYKALLDALPAAVREAVHTYEHKSSREITQRALEITSARCPQITDVRASWQSDAASVLTADSKGKALFPKLTKFKMAPNPKERDDIDPKWMIEFDGHRPEVDRTIWELEP